MSVSLDPTLSSVNLSAYVQQALALVDEWEASWGSFERHPSTGVEPEAFERALRAYAERLRGNYPFFHPRYAGQMLKPPHPAALVGYLAAMRINPNNHALDGGPPTSHMEKEVVRALAGLFSFPDDALGHLTGGGTVANLEALFVARELHPEKALAFSADAHYTHGRMAHVLRMPTRVLPTDRTGGLALDALNDALATGSVGTLVVTAGTTGLGVMDPIDEAVALCRRHGVRVHVDAAYGGFFRLLAHEADGPLAEPVRRRLRAIADCDSVVVDPHKHGLQPYGCGAVLFRDPAVGRFYRHDSPYTYFTSDELHLGEISLECSRPGAAAGALWLTLQLVPLAADRGLGPILTAGLRAANEWHARLGASEHLEPYRRPDLDIVTYFAPAPTASAVSRASAAVFERGMHDPDDPVFLSLYRVPSGTLAGWGVAADEPDAQILRSVLLKPEHEHAVDGLHARVEALASAANDEASNAPPAAETAAGPRGRA